MLKISRRIKILFLVIFILVLIIITALHILVNIKGRSLLESRLKEIFQREVAVGSVRATLPLNVVVRDIEVEGLFKIGKAYAQGGALDIFRKSFILSQLTLKRAEVSLKKTSSGSFQNLPSSGSVIPPGPAEGRVSSTGTNKEIIGPNFILKRLIISDSVFNFVDETIPQKSLAIIITDINLEVENLALPLKRSLVTSFTLKGRIPWQQGQEEGEIFAEGWLNLFKKDIQATLKILNIDGIALYPYYAYWVDLEKARIEKTTLNFTSNIQGLNNDVTADCHLELMDIVRKPKSQDQPQEKAELITDAVLDIFRALNQGRIVLNFTVKTKMDKPEFSFSNIKMAFENKLREGRKATGGGLGAEDVFGLPGKLVEGTVKGATDVTKSVIEGVADIGKELKKAVTGVFKEESKETPKEEIKSEQQIQPESKGENK